MGETTELARSLKNDLSRVRLAGLSSTEATAAVTAAVLTWCAEQGLDGRT